MPEETVATTSSPTPIIVGDYIDIGDMEFGSKAEFIAYISYIPNNVKLTADLYMTWSRPETEDEKVEREAAEAAAKPNYAKSILSYAATYGLKVTVTDPATGNVIGESA